MVLFVVVSIGDGATFESWKGEEGTSIPVYPVTYHLKGLLTSKIMAVENGANEISG